MMGSEGGDQPYQKFGWEDSKSFVSRPRSPVHFGAHSKVQDQQFFTTNFGQNRDFTIQDKGGHRGFKEQPQLSIELQMAFGSLENNRLQSDVQLTHYLQKNLHIEELALKEEEYN